RRCRPASTISLCHAPSPPAPSPLSLHDALPISADDPARGGVSVTDPRPPCLGRSVGRRKLHRVAGFALSQSDVLHADLSDRGLEDRKSTRLNSSHVSISYAVFCLKKKTTEQSLR